jgi:hypothetical protein
VVGRGRLGLVYVYGHFPWLAGVTVFGVATKLVIAEAGYPGLGGGARWTLAGGVPPVAFVSVVAFGVLGQLLLEAFTVRVGAASVVEPSGG